MYYQVRMPEILLPAFGPMNDSTRVNNMGKRLSSWREPHSTLNVFDSSSLSAAVPRSPRRGELRSVSEIALSYPEVNPLSPEGKVPQRLPPFEAPLPPKVKRKEEKYGVPDDPLGRSLGLMEALHMLRRVNKDDDDAEIESEAKAAAQRVKFRRCLARGCGCIIGGECADVEMDSANSVPPVSDMPADMDFSEDEDDTTTTRRPDSSPPGSPDAKPGSSLRAKSPAPTRPRTPDGFGMKPTSESDDIVRQTLKDREDTSNALREMHSNISKAQDKVVAFGGEREPVYLMCARLCDILAKKAKLLAAVEGRIEEFKGAQAEAETTVQMIVDLKAEPPEALLGIRKFISSYAHRHGNPEDADRLDFEHFLSNFKLPSRHHYLMQLRTLADEYGDWWAQATCRVATEGGHATAVQHLRDIAIGAGADEEHPMLLQTHRLLMSRLAVAVLQFAKDLQAKDAFAAQRAEERGSFTIGAASKAADDVDAEIAKAKEKGVKMDDERILEAHDISKALREADNQRKRMDNRQKRLKDKKAGG